MTTTTDAKGVSKNKSVLYIIDNYIYGGVTTFVKQYSETAYALGYTCTIIGFSGDMENPRLEFPHAQVIVIPKSMHHGSIGGRIVDGFFYIRALHDFYKSHDVAVVHSATTWSSLFALILPTTWRAHRVLTFYGAYDKEYLSMTMHAITIGTHIKMFFMRLLQTVTLNTSSVVITFSAYADKQIHESFFLNKSSRVYIIPGTISVSPSIKIARQHTPPTMLWIGRAEPRKGISPLLHALNLARQKKIYMKAIIASPVEYYRNYYTMEDYEQANLGLSVQFIHKANPTLQNELFDVADVFVMPSQELETFGMTMIESLARGIPVIGTPVGAIPEILLKIDKRLVTKGTTPTSIYRSLEWFCSLSKNERAALSKKSITYIQKYHAPALYRDRLKKAYTRAVVS